MMFGWQRLSDADRAKVLRGIEAARAFGGPYHLEIHPTNRCNLGCFFCSARDHRAGEEIDWGVLRHAVESAGDLRSVRLTGGGESLLYPHIGELLDLLAQRGVRIDDLTTNGLELGRLTPQLLATGVDEVSISLNEADRKAYARSMRVAPEKFDRVIENIETLNALRGDIEGAPTLTLKFFVWKDNWRDIPEMLDLADRLGADRVLLNAMQFLPEERRIGENEADDAKELLDGILEREAKREPLRLAFDLGAEPALGRFALETFHTALPQGTDPMPDIVTDPRRCEFCYMAWHSATIAATGKVYPCCNFEGEHDKVVGDLGAESLDAIWHGAGFQRMRREFRTLALLDGELEHSCRLQRFTEPACIDRRGCPMGYYLCSSDFYREAQRRLDAPRHAPRRLLAQAADGWVRAIHRLKH